MKLYALVAGLLVCAMAVFAEEKPTLAKARAKFEQADALLNQTYKSVSAGLTPQMAKELRDHQRQWIEYRDSMASDGRFNGTRKDGVDPEDPKKMVEYWTAMEGLTEYRIGFLKAFSGKEAAPGIPGDYDDFYLGSMTLTETKKGIQFSISVLRGPTGAEGGIDGVAIRNGNKAYYKEALEPGDGSEPAELTFTFLEGHIVKVEGKNTSEHTGFRAYFDGTYYKIKKPKAGRKARD